MRTVAPKNLLAFSGKHPEAKASLDRWYAVTRQLTAASTQDVLATFSGAKVLNGERVRFEVAGGNYRLIVAYDFGRQIAFIKFLGTHAQYDAIDALTVSAF